MGPRKRVIQLLHPDVDPYRLVVDARFQAPLADLDSTAAAIQLTRQETYLPVSISSGEIVNLHVLQSIQDNIHPQQIEGSRVRFHGDNSVHSLGHGNRQSPNMCPDEYDFGSRLTFPKKEAEKLGVVPPLERKPSSQHH